MTLDELAATLPNGFHDALVHGCELDFEERRVVVHLSLWTGDLHEQEHARRERHDRFRLVLEGVRFFHIEPPAPGYPYAAARPVRVELCGPDRGHALIGEQPAGVFAARFFVEEWNAYIHLAAEEADLVGQAQGGA
jgi:hypothetical protein